MSLLSSYPCPKHHVGVLVDLIRIVHLDEKNPHAHCVFVPITADGRLCAKEIIGGKNKNEARQRMRDLHTRFAEVRRKYGIDRGEDIRETGARHRSTDEYNRDIHRENARLESAISDKSERLSRLEKQLRKAETRVKGLTTMIQNLERQEWELNDEIAQLEEQIDIGTGDVSELRCRIASLEDQLESTGQKLLDKRDKLKTADRQLEQLKEELDSLSKKRDTAQKNYHEFTEKNQEQVRMRLTDAVFARMVVDVRSIMDTILPEQKADIDCDFLTAIAETPNEILKCAMYLFLGYLDAVSQHVSLASRNLADVGSRSRCVIGEAESYRPQLTQSCGGGTSSDLPWGHNPNEDDPAWPIVA